MAYRVTISPGVRMAPPALSGSGTRQEYGPGDHLIELTGTGDTLAHIILDPDDFTPGGSKPAIEMDLDDGSDPEIVVAVTVGGGGEDIDYTIIQKVAGVPNDFDLVRAISIKAIPYDKATPAVTPATAKLQALVLLGDTSSDVWDRQIHQIGFDTAASGQTAAGCNLAVIPQGHTHDTAHTLNVRIYEALKARIIITLAGK